MKPENQTKQIIFCLVLTKLLVSTNQITAESSYGMKLRIMKLKMN